MKFLISAALGLGLAAAPIASAFAFSPAWTNETPTPGSYAPGSAYAPIHGTHDKGAAVRVNERAASLMSTQPMGPSSAYALYNPQRSR